MSYAIRNDGHGYRGVDGPDDVAADEWFSDGPPPVPVPLPPTDGEAADQERAWRDSKLSAVIWLRDRHRDQLEIEVDTTLSGEQFTELLVYMQALRDWPQSPDFPDSQHRPTAPDWIADQTP